MTVSDLPCAGCQVMGLVQTAVFKAASALSAQLALTFFMPLCLTAIAILARVRVRQAFPRSFQNFLSSFSMVSLEVVAYVDLFKADAMPALHSVLVHLFRCWQASGCWMRLRPTMCSSAIFQHCRRTSPMVVHQQLPHVICSLDLINLGPCSSALWWQVCDMPPMQGAVCHSC